MLRVFGMLRVYFEFHVAEIIDGEIRSSTDELHPGNRVLSQDDFHRMEGREISRGISAGKDWCIAGRVPSNQRAIGVVQLNG